MTRAQTATLLVLLSLAGPAGGCLIDRSALAPPSPRADAVVVEVPDAPDVVFPDAWSDLDAFVVERPDAPIVEDDAYEPPDAWAPDAFVDPDAFAPADAPLGCMAETCDAADDDCDGAVDEGACIVAGAACTTGRFGSSAYLQCSIPRSWTEARAVCQSFGYEFGAINSPEENTAVSAFSTSDIWLGFSDSGTEGIFVWDDGSPVTFMGWGDSEPNDAGMNEDCAYMRGDGGWNDANCMDGRAFLCEAEIRPR